MAAPLPTDRTNAELSPLPTAEEATERERELSHSQESCSSSPAVQILTLTAELQEKDRLIELLTERLEQAAEQLDRVHRTGMDRSSAQAAQGASIEVVARQLALADRLESAIIGWETAEAPALLARIEARMEALTDLIRDSQWQGCERSSSSAVEQHSAESPKPAGNGPEGWDALKARLLSESPSDNHHPVSSGHADAPGADSPLTKNAAEANDESVELPIPIDGAESDPEILRNAVFIRDAYVCTLVARLRQYRNMPSPDWESLANAPEELCRAIELLEHRLNEEVKQEELALSLERARLGREQAQLKQLRTRLEKEIRRLGQNPGLESPENTASPEVSMDAMSGPQRGGTAWARLFGRKPANS